MESEKTGLRDLQKGKKIQPPNRKNVTRNAYPLNRIRADSARRRRRWFAETSRPTQMELIEEPGK